MTAQFHMYPAHGFILLLAAVTVLANYWGSFLVYRARKKYNIQSPQMYAEQSNVANAYNCVQRAHQNILENLPIFYALLFTSIFRPVMASIVGLVRVVAFIVYVIEYSRGDPKKRFYGYIVTLVAVGMNVEASLRIFDVIRR